MPGRKVPALLALLLNKPGAEKVKAVLDGALLGTVNYAEVVSHYAKLGANRADIDWRWPRLAGQVGGEDKLFPDSDHAAICRLDTVAGACPGDGVEPLSL